MKRILGSLLVIGMIASCAVDKQILSSSELKRWCSRKDTLYYDCVPVAVFTGYEMELYKGDITIELCIEQINDTLIPISSIVSYVHTFHRDDKVQVISTYSKNKIKYGIK